MHRHELSIDLQDTCLRGRRLLVTGWPQSRDITAARLEVGLSGAGPTRARLCLLQRIKTSDGKANRHS